MANLTITVPDDLLRRARARAASEGRSVSAVVRAELTRYVDDDAEPTKQEVARAVLRRRSRPRTSPQVLCELYVVARSKLGLSAQNAEAAVRAGQPTVAVVEAARRAGATTLLSEDLQHGMDFDGVVVENPFRSV